MPRDVTMAELVKMLEEGDQLSNDSPVTINGLDEIIAQLKVVAAINSELLKKTTELSELIVDKIQLREEKSKPINLVGEREGICELCGDYTAFLFEHDGVMVCKDCRD